MVLTSQPSASVKAHNPKTPKVRFFAYNESGIVNGSFCSVTAFPVYARGMAYYINGDFAGKTGITLEEIETQCANLVAEGRVEFSRDVFKKLAPQCVGGRGRG